MLHVDLPNDRGIGWTLVRTWPHATRADEKHLKGRKYGNRLCPLCTPKTTRGLVLPSGWERKRVYRPTTRFSVPSVSRILRVGTIEVEGEVPAPGRVA